jgi:hypothetical protein
MHPQSAYHTVLPGLPDEQGINSLAGWLFLQTFRRDFSQPGFSLVSFGQPVGSHDLRRLMVALKGVLGRLYHRDTGKHLVYLSMARFDQQATTKFHLDGAPDESFLMLGYEPSEVESRLAVADYTKASFDLGITPRLFIEDYNPMYHQGERLLTGYVTHVVGFDRAGSHILLLNNSILPFTPDRANLLGVMHQATIVTLLPEKSRVVNSTMLVTAADPAEEAVAGAAQQEFIDTHEVRR